MKNLKLLIQNWGTMENRNAEGWDKPRTLKFEYNYETNLSGEEVAEEAFLATNAPEEIIPDHLQFVHKEYKGSSVSVGDVVEVDGVQYLCASRGWETK